MLAEVLGERVVVRQIVAADGGEPGSVTGADQLGRLRELHQRVAPVEENGLEHGSLG